MRHSVLLFLWCGLFVSGGAYSQTVDPRNPNEWRAMQPQNARELSRWLPTRIRQLAEERSMLLGIIADLPQHAPRALSDHMGFHSIPLGEGEAGDRPFSRIEVEFKFDPGLGAVAMVPAIVPGKAGCYAFPKRFKIEALDRGAGWVGGVGGKWLVPDPPYEWREVADWMDEDFPNPGPYPVFFQLSGQKVHRLRLTMSSSDSGETYQALGELYLFRDPEKSDQLGDNMMAWNDAVLSTINGLSKPPVWDESYLNDGVVGLGMPLSEKVSDVEDFRVLWKPGEVVKEPVQLVLDLGKTQQIGRIQLCPADAPQGMAIPRFGFPGQVVVEIATLPDFSDALRFEVRDVHDRLHADSFLNITTGAHKARYVRIRLQELGVYMGRQVLSLGEIRVSEYDKVWSLNCAVSATGLPPDAIPQLPRLVDGFSRKRRILREVDWVKGLALRRPLDQRLVVVETELAQARDQWDSLRLKAAIWGGGLLCFGLLGAMGLQRLQRRKVLQGLRHRITRDLHDEVGSSLGGITLAARRMEQTGAEPEDLAELSLMAREASASLRDVVWVIDQARIHLPDLLKKLCERAERVLRGLDLQVELPQNCPNLEVPLPFKRHLLMLFKEAIHNCARHAAATEVRIRIDVQDGMLTLGMSDNGCGFDPAAPPEGWGLESMRKRAEELGGRMELQTAPGNGTTIRVRIPLSALRNGTDHSYKTSN